MQAQPTAGIDYFAAASAYFERSLWLEPDEARCTHSEVKREMRRQQKVSQDQLAFDLQPRAYKMGARVHGFDGPATKLIITTQTRQPAVQEEVVPRSKAEEQELACVAASVLRAIDAGVDHPVHGWQCRSCKHAGRCC